MSDEKRNTFKYKGYDISVVPDEESVSGLSFKIPDRSFPKSYFTFAYFDDIDKFIKVGCDWDKFLGR